MPKPIILEPDADQKNADWPKRTDDRMSALTGRQEDDKETAPDDADKS